MWVQQLRRKYSLLALYTLADVKDSTKSRVLYIESLRKKWAVEVGDRDIRSSE